MKFSLILTFKCLLDESLLSLYVYRFQIRLQKVPFLTFSTFLVTKILEGSLVFVWFFSNFHQLNGMRVIIAWASFDFDHFSFWPLPFRTLSPWICFCLYFRIFFRIFYRLNLGYSYENFNYFPLCLKKKELILKRIFCEQKLLIKVWKYIFAVKYFISLHHASF